MNENLEERIRRLERELDAEPDPGRTWFLDPTRETTPRLAAQISVAASSPIVEAVLKTGIGAIAVLNERRQVVALNAGYLSLLGVKEPGAALGLRHGEAVRCVRVQDAPAGCGTGPACRTCGAAISIVSALESGTAAERDCALTLERDGKLVDAEFRVRSQILEMSGERFVVLSLVDVSAERRRAMLERAIFHDLTELLGAVVGACDEMDGTGAGEITVAAADAREVAATLSHELALQRALMAPVPTGYAPTFVAVPLGGIVDGLRARFLRHPVTVGKRLRVSGSVYDSVIETDPYLLQRVVTNLMLNAFEASPPRAEIALRVDVSPGEAIFRVWNPGAIPVAVAPRIFQRYFSTSGDPGRGQGSFVAKYFGEQVLRGRVGFTSTREGGTTFEVRVPRSLRP